MNKLILILIALIFSHSVRANVNVSFQIDEEYLIAHTLTHRSKRIKTSPYITNFKNSVWNNTFSLYKLLKKVTYFRPKDLQLANPLLNPLFDEAKKLSAYKRLLDETEEFRKEMEKEWQTDFLKTYKKILEITKLPIKGHFTVFVTHPAVGNGHYLGNNKIAFGTKAEWSHYYSVYIWHEILHAYMESDVVSHAVNQIITDNGLRFFLKSNNNDANFGHPYLFKLMYEIQEKHWNPYLNNKSENILQFVERVKKNPIIKKLKEIAELEKHKI